MAEDLGDARLNFVGDLTELARKVEEAKLLTKAGLEDMARDVTRFDTRLIASGQLLLNRYIDPLALGFVKDTKLAQLMSGAMRELGAATGEAAVGFNALASSSTEAARSIARANEAIRLSSGETARAIMSDSLEEVRAINEVAEAYRRLAASQALVGSGVGGFVGQGPVRVPNLAEGSHFQIAPVAPAQIASGGAGSHMVLWGTRGSSAPGSINNPITMAIESGQYAGLGARSAAIAASSTPDSSVAGGSGGLSRSDLQTILTAINAANTQSSNVSPFSPDDIQRQTDVNTAILRHLQSQPAIGAVPPYPGQRQITSPHEVDVMGRILEGVWQSHVQREFGPFGDRRPVGSAFVPGDRPGTQFVMPMGYSSTGAGQRQMSPFDQRFTMLGDDLRQYLRGRAEDQRQARLPVPYSPPPGSGVVPYDAQQHADNERIQKLLEAILAAERRDPFAAGHRAAEQQAAADPVAAALANGPIDSSSSSGGGPPIAVGGGGGGGGGGGMGNILMRLLWGRGGGGPGRARFGRFGFGLLGMGAGLGSLASFGGLGADHALLTGGAVLGSAAQGAAGGGLLALGALGQTAVGGGSDLAVMKSTIADTKTLSTAMTQVQQQIAIYGAQSTQAAHATAALNFQIAQLGGHTAGVNAQLQLAKSTAALNTFWDKATSQARVQAVNILQQVVQLGHDFVPRVASAAQQNLSIINVGLRPLFAWLRGPAGIGVFNNLEDNFRRNLPTAVHAFSQGIEAFLRITSLASNYTGRFLNTIDNLMTRLNNQPNAQMNQWIGRLIGDFRLWERLVKALGTDLYLLFKQDAGTGNSIVATLTNMLNKLGEWLRTTQGQVKIHNLFEVHKQEALALLHLLPGLISGFGRIYLALAPPLTKLVTIIVDLIGKVQDLGPAFATALAGAYLLRRLGLLGTALGGIATLVKGIATGLGLIKIEQTLGPGGVPGLVKGGAAAKGGSAALSAAETGGAAAGGGLIVKGGRIIGTLAKGLFTGGAGGVVERGGLAAASGLEALGASGAASGVAGFAGAVAPFVAVALPLVLGTAAFTAFINTFGTKPQDTGIGGPQHLGGITTANNNLLVNPRVAALMSSDQRRELLRNARGVVQINPFNAAPPSSTAAALTGAGSPRGVGFTGGRTPIPGTSLDSVRGLPVNIQELGQLGKFSGYSADQLRALIKVMHAAGDVRINGVKVAKDQIIQLAQASLLVKEHFNDNFNRAWSAVNRFYRDSGRGIKQLKDDYRSNLAIIDSQIGSGTSLGRKMWAENIKKMIGALDQGMLSGKVSVKDGMAELNKVLNEGVKNGAIDWKTRYSDMFQTLRDLYRKHKIDTQGYQDGLKKISHDAAVQIKTDSIKQFQTTLDHLKQLKHDGILTDQQYHDAVHKAQVQANSQASTDIQGFVTNMFGGFKSVVDSGGKGMQKLLDNINSALKLLHVAPLTGLQVQTLEGNAALINQKIHHTAQRGAMVQFGRHGDRGHDTIATNFGGTDILVAPGEVGVVLTGDQQHVVNSRLADMGGLPGLFRAHSTPHAQTARGYSVGGAVQSAAAAPYRGYSLPLPRSMMSQGNWSVDQGVDIPGGVGGEPEFAIGPGVIIQEGISGFGPNAPILRIDPGAGPLGGRQIYYGHAGPDLVKTGQHVQAGEQISIVGRGIVGQSTGPHIEIGFWPSSGGAEMVPVLHQLLTGAGVTGVGITGGAGATVAVPNIKEPQVRGSGKMAQLVRAGIHRATQAGQRYVNRHAPASGIGAAGVAGSAAGISGNVRQMVHELVGRFHWSAGDEQNWLQVISQESGGNPTAQNPTSTAYGIGQFLDSTWGSYGTGPKTSDPRLQLLYMGEYIKGKYGTPTAAEAYELSHHSYARGGMVRGFAGGGALKPQVKVLGPGGGQSYDVLTSGSTDSKGNSGGFNAAGANSIFGRIPHGPSSGPWWAEGDRGTSTAGNTHGSGIGKSFGGKRGGQAARFTFGGKSVILVKVDTGDGNSYGDIYPPADSAIGFNKVGRGGPVSVEFLSDRDALAQYGGATSTKAPPPKAPTYTFTPFTGAPFVPVPGLRPGHVPGFNRGGWASPRPPGMFASHLAAAGHTVAGSTPAPKSVPAFMRWAHHLWGKLRSRGFLPRGASFPNLVAQAAGYAGIGQFAQPYSFGRNVYFPYNAVSDAMSKKHTQMRNWAQEALVHEFAHTMQRTNLKGSGEIEGGAQAWADQRSPLVLSDWKAPGDANYSPYVNWVKHARGWDWIDHKQFAGAFAQGGSVTAHGPTMALFGEHGTETATFMPHAQSGFSTALAVPGGSSNRHQAPPPNAQQLYAAGYSRGQNPNNGLWEWHTKAQWSALHRTAAKSGKGQTKSSTKTTTTTKPATPQFTGPPFDDPLMFLGREVGEVSVPKSQLRAGRLPFDKKTGDPIGLLGPTSLVKSNDAGFKLIIDALNKFLDKATPQKAFSLAQAVFLRGHISSLDSAIKRMDKKAEELQDKAMKEHGKQRKATMEKAQDIGERASKDRAKLLRLTEIQNTLDTHALAGISGLFGRQQAIAAQFSSLASILGSLAPGAKTGLDKFQLGRFGLTPKQAAKLTGSTPEALGAQLHFDQTLEKQYAEDANHLEKLYKHALKTRNKKLADALLKQLDAVSQAELQAGADVGTAYANQVAAIAASQSAWVQGITDKFTKQATDQGNSSSILAQIQNLKPGTDLSAMGLTPQVLALAGVNPQQATGLEGSGLTYLQNLQTTQGGGLTQAQIQAAKAGVDAQNQQLQAQQQTDSQQIQALQASLPSLSGDALTAAQQQIATLTGSILGLQTTMTDNTTSLQALTTATNANTTATGQMTGTVTYAYQGQNFLASTTPTDPGLGV